MALNLSYKPEVVVSTDGLTEDEWLDYRRKGIGGSDVAAVMGFSPFCTTRDLYYDKRGIRPAIDEQPNWVTLKIGHLLEPLVAEIFSAKTGYRTFQIHKMFYHPLFPFMQADVDYFIETPDGRQGILECKTSNPNNKEKWANESVPLNYEWQCRHYMAVMNLDFVWIACLFSNTDNDFVMRKIERDLDIEADMIAAESDFWNGYVQAGVEPPYTEKGDMVLESIRKHYGASDPTASAVRLSDTVQINLDAYLSLREKKLEHDRLSKQIDGEMKKALSPVLDDMGVAEKAVLTLSTALYEVSYASKYRTSVSKENLERLKRDHPDIYDEYVTQTESRSATVKRKEA
jgi:putative phage-type endonuclease